MSRCKLVNISRQQQEQNANHLPTFTVTSTHNAQKRNRQSMQVKGTYRRDFERLNGIDDVTEEHIVLQCVVVQHRINRNSHRCGQCKIDQ